MENLVNIKKFCCVPCAYFSDNNGNFKQHIKTKKHIEKIKPKTETYIQTEVQLKEFKCSKCVKHYTTQSGLWKHSKLCKVAVDNIIPINVDNVLPIVVDIAFDLTSEINKLKNIITELVSNKQVPLTTINNNNNSITNNNNFNINVFLNETCKNAINLDSFIKNLMFELVDPKMMIGNYVDGTCSILQKNLSVLPLNKRPLHCLEGEDPNQHLMHIRQDDKWNIGTYVNWLEQIHAEDDDDVLDKNPIYYALKTIDEEKLKYLGYNHYQDADYKLQHGRLNREISRQDLKKIVYTKLLKMITLDQNVI